MYLFLKNQYYNNENGLIFYTKKGNALPPSKIKTNQLNLKSKYKQSSPTNQKKTSVL